MSYIVIIPWMLLFAVIGSLYYKQIAKNFNSFDKALRAALVPKKKVAPLNR